jgi:ribosome biogenesis GTPase
MTNEDLGYNSTFEENKLKLALSDFVVARVISESRGAYMVKNAEGEYRAKITGKHIHSATSRESYPAVGDWVAITILNEEQAVIHAILPRVTVLKRKFGDKNRNEEKSRIQIIAANIDVALIIESVDRDFSLNRFERYFLIAQNGGVTPAIILNKIDLLTTEELQDKLAQLHERFPNTDIISTTTRNDTGLDELKKYISKGKTYCFLGSSGVGKSSLINKLLNTNSIKTGDISSYSGRGAHTTTARQMYFMENGGIVIDNPGTREVGIAEEEQSVEVFFDEINALAAHCKFVDCTHTQEPGCKVIEAVKAGTLDEEKYQNYLNLKKEAEYFDLNTNEKRLKEKQIGKFIKTAKKTFRDLGT